MIKVGQDIVTMLEDYCKGHPTDSKAAGAAQLAGVIQAHLLGLGEELVLIIHPGAGALGDMAKTPKDKDGFFMERYVDAGFAGCSGEANKLPGLIGDGQFAVVVSHILQEKVEANAVSIAAAREKCNNVVAANIAFIDDKAGFLEAALGVPLETISGRISESSMQQYTHQAYPPCAIKIGPGRNGAKSEVFAVVSGISVDEAGKKTRSATYIEDALAVTEPQARVTAAP